MQRRALTERPSLDRMQEEAPLQDVKRATDDINMVRQLEGRTRTIRPGGGGRGGNLDFCTVRAAGAKAATVDGVALAKGDRICVPSGAGYGVWSYTGTGAVFKFLGRYEVVAVKEGTAAGYGRSILFLVSAVYVKNYAVFS